jgi:hypothetical protein
MSLPPDELPLFVGPIAVTILFYLATDPDEPPDLDKLARSTFDALTVCRVFEDDARVRIAHLSKTAATSTEPPGAFILVAPYRPWRREAARLRARELERRAARWGVFFGSA